MKRKVLFVDDEQHILDTFRASLRKRYKVRTALGPEEGLEQIEKQGPFAVVVSDLKMPGMDGITFLRKVQAKCPDTVRIMLTGHADLDSAIDAVNKGSVFRFLTKPSPMDEMIRTLDTAMEQYSLVVAEKELLRGTLRGSVKMLTDVLSLVNPEAFGRGERVKRLALYVGQKLRLKHLLSLELAAMLSQIGCVTVSDGILKKVYFGEELDTDETEAFRTHPQVASQLLANIPRMAGVADIIMRQDERLDQSQSLPIEARILKACLDYDSLVQRGLEKQDAMDSLRARAGWYDTDVLDVLERGTAGEEGYIRREVALEDLRPGMILDDSLWSLDEVHLMAKGMEITDTGLMRLGNFKQGKRLPRSIRVLIPLDGEEEQGTAGCTCRPRL